MAFSKTVLEGNHTRLEPLAKKHIDGICAAISDGELWKLFVTRVPHINDIETFFNHAFLAQQNGEGLTYATIDIASNTVAGSTRFMKADILNQRVEIGFTFLGKTFQKTKINTEAKLLMLTQAFEVDQFNRVELLTDYLNQVSRNAILRLGAKQEGILRNHMVMPDGRIRDSVLFSIIKNEWLDVKQNLESKLTQIY